MIEHNPELERLGVLGQELRQEIDDLHSEMRHWQRMRFEFELEEWIRDIDELKPGWRKSPDLLAMVKKVLKKIDEK